MFRGIHAGDECGHAHWECHYFFQKGEDDEPRSVHNDIRASFRFEDGLIREHHDKCDFDRWAKQALGTVATAASWFDFTEQKLQEAVRKTARQKIDAFIAEHPQYAD